MLNPQPSMLPRFYALVQVGTRMRDTCIRDTHRHRLSGSCNAVCKHAWDSLAAGKRGGGIKVFVFCGLHAPLLQPLSMLRSLNHQGASSLTYKSWYRSATSADEPGAEAATMCCSSPRSTPRPTPNANSLTLRCSCRHLGLAVAAAGSHHLVMVGRIAPKTGSQKTSTSLCAVTAATQCTHPIHCLPGCLR